MYDRKDRRMELSNMTARDTATRAYRILYAIVDHNLMIFHPIKECNTQAKSSGNTC